MKTKKKPVGKFLFVWKLKKSEFPALAKGATFSNRADTQEDSLDRLKDSEWGAFFNDETEAVLIKQI